MDKRENAIKASGKFGGVAGVLQGVIYKERKKEIRVNKNLKKKKIEYKLLRRDGF